MRSHTDLPPTAKGQLEVVNRNGLRLLRLVNTLLDFARIEAGRVQAVFEPTDLAAFTTELVSVFRAATERAGLRLIVDRPVFPEPVYVDRDMWEKIVLNLVSTAVGAAPFVEEALRWLPESPEQEEATPPAVHQELIPVPCPPGQEEQTDRPRVLIADDNADIRHYLARLLRERYRVEMVPDGQAALAAARENHPDLVLTDVMMPNLDGFGLVGQLRADTVLKTIPVILLSARAGEESRAEGLQQGADDYLIKPFSARELMARVAAHLDMARLRRESAEQIRQSEALYRAIARNFPNGAVYVFDRDLRFRVADGEALATLGYTREALEGKTIWEATDPKTCRILEERYPRVLAGESLHFETALKGHVFSSAYVPIRDEQGTVIAGLVVSHDIAERKRAEETLRGSEARYRAVVENTTAVILRIDPSGVVTFANSRALEFFGDSAEELTGKHVVGTIVPEKETTGRDLAGMVDQIAAHPDRFHSNANENLCKDGRRVWMEWTNSGIYDAQGRLTEFLSVGIDATDRRRTEEERERLLKSVEEKHSLPEAVFASMDEAVGVWSADGNLVSINDATVKLYGFETKEQMLKHLSEYADVIVQTLDGRDLPQNQWPPSRALRGESFSNWLLKQEVPAKGLKFVGSNAGAPIRDADGEVTSR